VDGVKGFAVGAGYEVCEVTQELAMKIIETREPIGLFMALCRDEKYVGIDNSTGQAWTENFDDIESCINWLADPEKTMPEPCAFDNGNECIALKEKVCQGCSFFKTAEQQYWERKIIDRRLQKLGYRQQRKRSKKNDTSLHSKKGDD